ncbi:unnamed protein product [Orchesella dallaii]|uniref:Ig-like domain-containing protein n=1 Tax=Orchesella dallaii TaxID=48710 RepID=A0ABP1PRE8_9HEXA
MLSKPALSFAFIFVAIKFLHNYECAKRFSSRRHSSNPEFWLGRYSIVNQKLVSVATEFIHSTFEDDFISKNESDYVISEDVISVLLICEAKYPIEVKFLHPEKLTYPSVHLRTIFERISEFNEDLEEPRTQDYVLYTSISFANVKFFSSTLVCQSVENSAIISSVHVYKLSFSGIERQGETIQLSVDAQTPLQVELPCRPATPTASITLQKQTQTTVWRNEEFDNIPIWSDFKWSSFDPKIGFTLTLPKTQIYFDSMPPPVSLFGLYKCSISGGDDDQFVFVNVTRKSADQASNDLPFKTKFILRGKANAGLVTPDEKHPTHYDNGLYQCCSGVPSKPPSLLVLPCETTLECDVFKTMLVQIEKHVSNLKRHRPVVPHHLHRNVSSDCAMSVIYGGSVIVRCTGENVDITEEYYKLITSNEQAITQYKSETKRTSSRPVKEQRDCKLRNGRYQFQFEKMFSQIKYAKWNMCLDEPLSFAWSAGVNRKIGISIGKPVPTYKWGTNRKGNTRFFMIAFYNLRNSLHSPESTSKLPTINILTVKDKTRDIYEGESIYCVCFKLSMFHADGGYVRINWKNGTNLVLEEAEYGTAIIDSSSTNSIHLSIFDGFSLNPTIATLIKADMEMSSVECFQPLWNSSRWERMKVTLEVHGKGKNYPVKYF